MEGLSFSLAGKELFTLIFYLAALILTVHTIVFAYHWYSFGAEQKTSFIGILIYMLGGLFLIGALALSLWYI